MEKDQINILIIESNVIVQGQITQSIQLNTLPSHFEIVIDTDEALLKIIDFNPDLIFLEYPVKGNAGNGLIKFVQSKFPDTTLVFVSISKKFAAEAIHYGVYDYLLNPVKIIKVGRILEKVQLRKLSNSFLKIKEIIDNKQEGIKLRFNTIKGLIIVSPDEILFCRADGNYTELHFINKSNELTFIILAKIEEILAPYNFMRINRSTLINKNYIRKVFLLANTLILSANGVEYEIKGSKEPIKNLRKIYTE
jgi:two-component system, LytTR family, response regulator